MYLRSMKPHEAQINTLVVCKHTAHCLPLVDRHRSAPEVFVLIEAPSGRTPGSTAAA